MIDVTIQFKEDEVRQAYCFLTGKIATDEELQKLMSAEKPTIKRTPERAMILMTLLSAVVETNTQQKPKSKF